VTTVPTEAWSPGDYGNFRDARRRPFFDLLAMVERSPSPRLVLDAGCGTGELTHEAHRALGAQHTIGVDASSAMLAQARAEGGVTFHQGTVPDGLPDGPFDVILSNSALNWVADHASVLAALARRLGPSGQLAVQMPYNVDAPFSRCCQAVAESPEFKGELEGYVYESPVQPPEFYARALDALGFVAVRAGAWLYPQRHADVGGLVDFARGGLLSAYRPRLAPARFEAFVGAYREALQAALNEAASRQQGAEALRDR
jgi:trans-aconitate 2-methyltransferase